MAQRKNDKTKGKKVASSATKVMRGSKSGRYMVTEKMPRRLVSGVYAKANVVSVNKGDLAVIKEGLTQAEMDTLIELAGDDIQDVLDRLEDR